VTSPQISAVLTNASQNYRLVFCNPGAPCSQAQIANFIGNVPIVQSLPATVYYLFDQRQANVLNLDVRGLDISASYSYSSERAGTFSAGSGGAVKHSESGGISPVPERSGRNAEPDKA
jgi:hypothetical protein